MNSKVLFPEESYAIMGCCFAVYKELGSGFLEPVYQESLEIELADKGIPFEAQPDIGVFYRGRRLKHAYKPDFICCGRIVVEIKATANLVSEHRSQLLNYLHATRQPLGLLVNFGHHPKMQSERFANTREDEDNAKPEP